MQTVTFRIPLVLIFYFMIQNCYEPTPKLASRHPPLLEGLDQKKRELSKDPMNYSAIKARTSQETHFRGSASFSFQTLTLSTTETWAWAHSSTQMLSSPEHWINHQTLALAEQKANWPAERTFGKWASAGLGEGIHPCISLEQNGRQQFMIKKRLNGPF